MSESQGCDGTVVAFIVDYEHYLVDVHGLALNSCRLHKRVVRGLLNACFPAGDIRWPDLSFTDVAGFLTKEFRRLPNHWTQKAWLMAVRGLLRYLESNRLIPAGWGDVLPRRVNRKHASLPRCFSPEQMRALWKACEKKTYRHLRDRAMLLVYTRLALRTEEVAGLTIKDIDWSEGKVLICSTKTRRDRTLPLPQDVGDGLIEHIRARPQMSAQVFAPVHAPFTALRCHSHVRNCMAALFRRAGLPHARLHSFRHTAASSMVNRGASFKDIADVLGHRLIATTLIYAKLDLNALSKVCLPWPGGSQ
jgi:integrase/recombinase XerD